MILLTSKRAFVCFPDPRWRARPQPQDAGVKQCRFASPESENRGHKQEAASVRLGSWTLPFSDELSCSL
ncbi:MAG: hypothetical protein AB1733_01495 [Thermodesulfobacteriota bacterium]